jgi:hypothetical protein
MPSQTDVSDNANYITQANTLYLATYPARYQSAVYYLDNYTAPGGGAMPSFTWSAPTGDSFSYVTGDLSFNTSPFAGLNTEQKRKFFRYLNKFIGACLLNYNITNNL